MKVLAFVLRVICHLLVVKFLCVILTLSYIQEACFHGIRAATDFLVILGLYSNDLELSYEKEDIALYNINYTCKILHPIVIITAPQLSVRMPLHDEATDQGMWLMNNVKFTMD